MHIPPPSGAAVLVVGCLSKRRDGLLKYFSVCVLDIVSINEYCILMYLDARVGLHIYLCFEFGMVSV